MILLASLGCREIIGSPPDFRERAHRNKWPNRALSVSESATSCRFAPARRPLVYKSGHALLGNTLHHVARHCLDRDGVGACRMELQLAVKKRLAGGQHGSGFGDDGRR